MPVQWTDDLSVGVLEIDNQHKELFSRVNGLLDAMGDGQGKQELENVIGFLAEYVVKHFAAEEEYMLRLNYPNYEAHRGQHEAFVDDFAALKQQLETSGASTSLVIEANRRVVSWLTGHIRKTDKQLGAFMASKLAA